MTSADTADREIKLSRTLPGAARARLGSLHRSQARRELVGTERVLHDDREDGRAARRRVEARDEGTRRRPLSEPHRLHRRREAPPHRVQELRPQGGRARHRVPRVHHLRSGERRHARHAPHGVYVRGSPRPDDPRVRRRGGREVHARAAGRAPAEDGRDGPRLRAHPHPGRAARAGLRGLYRPEAARAVVGPGRLHESRLRDGRASGRPIPDRHALSRGPGLSPRRRVLRGREAIEAGDDDGPAGAPRRVLRGARRAAALGGKGEAVRAARDDHSSRKPSAERP